jgi:CheY-like chemotaxis protein
MKITLPVYQHPTQIVLIDDSASFIDSLEFHLKPNFAVKSFRDANEALAWLREVYGEHHEKWLPIRVGYDEQTLSFDRRTIALDIDRVYRIAMDSQRFATPAVIVVDYAMPQMNGLELCRKLAGLPCKKIMFTGEADEMIAVEAFNDGNIDRYLKKCDVHALNKLEEQIKVLERDYFVEQSGTLKDLLVKHSFSFLSDPTFAHLVESLTKQHKFVEYFLFPNPAGILFIDADGKPTLMVVETKVGLVSHLETAQDYGAPQELQDALRDAQIVPFFWKSGGMYTEKSKLWKEDVKPANVCQGQEEYFWALFDLPEGFLDSPICSYKEFLAERN